MGTIILVYADLTEYLNHRNGWVVFHISKFKITIDIFPGPTWKEPPKPKLMTIEEIDSDYDPNKGKERVEGG